MPSEKRRWTWSELSLSPSPCPWRRQYRPCQFRRCKHRTTLSRTSGRHVVWVTRASLDAACATPLCAITGALSVVAHVDCVVSTADASADTARKRRGSSNGGVVAEIGDLPRFQNPRGTLRELDRGTRSTAAASPRPATIAPEGESPGLWRDIQSEVQETGSKRAKGTRWRPLTFADVGALMTSISFSAAGSENHSERCMMV